MGLIDPYRQNVIFFQQGRKVKQNPTVKTGECVLDLSVKVPGPLSKSRWLNCATRILGLYISEVKPSDEIKCWSAIL